MQWTNNDLLLLNDFVSTSELEVPEDQANSFKEYMERVRAREEKQKQITLVKKRQEPLQNEQAVEVKKTPPATFVPQWSIKSHKIHVDSENRNKLLYPSASDFVISWGKTLQNVVELSLRNMAVPNIDQSVSNDNNKLYWINKEDYDLEPPFPVYVASINTGSYELLTLKPELIRIMGQVSRHGGLPYDDGTPAVNHYFVVEANMDTMYVGFTNLHLITPSVNPISTMANSNVVNVTLENHGFADNDRVHILGVKGIIGGINGIVLNGAYNVTIVDADNFTFVANAIATVSAVGGGVLVKIGRELPFQFLFGRYPDTIADIIGFRTENSSADVPVEDPLTSIVRPIVGIIPSDTLSKIICPDHGLREGDLVYLNNVHVSPSIYEGDRHKGIFRVFSVSSPDSFEILYGIQRVSNIYNAFVGTQIISMHFPDHGFNRVTSIVQESPGVVQIVTLLDHGLVTGDKIRLCETNSVPNIDGLYVVTVVNEDTFTVANPAHAANVITNGFRGFLMADTTFYLYNVSPFGGFTLTDLNNSPFKVRDIMDKDNFVFSTHNGFATVGEKGGGTSVRINSNLHGWSGVHDNSPNGILNKPVELSGNNYAFMCIPDINLDQVSTTGNVKNAVSKLLLTSLPNTYIFNQIDTDPIIFDPPLPVLDKLRLQIRTPDNLLMQAPGFHYSCSFAVKYLDLQEPENTDTNQRRIGHV